MSIQSAEDLADSQPLTKRDVRAARDCMTVYEEAPLLYSVSTQSGSEYMVDLESGACTCGDWEYRTPQNGCKHRRRVLYEIGEKEIPDIPGVDPLLEGAESDR